ncbi:MAG: 5-formyltetrahydrofolate cyclo-ligase [Bacillota bacterium]
MSEKEKLRELYQNKRKQMDKTVLKNKSVTITDKIYRYIKEGNYKNVMIFVSFRNEIYTHDLIKKLLDEDRINIYVPYIDKNVDEMKISHITNFTNDLKPGVYGILEPKQKLRDDNNLVDKLDLIIIPGLVYSRDGYRIGYGGGYYDKFLSSISEEVKKVGIVYSNLVIDKLPVNSYDIPVDLIITDKKNINP